MRPKGTFRKSKRNEHSKSIEEDPPCGEEHGIGLFKRFRRRKRPALEKGVTLGKSKRNERSKSIEEDPPREEEHRIGLFRRFWRGMRLALAKGGNFRKLKLILLFKSIGKDSQLTEECHSTSETEKVVLAGWANFGRDLIRTPIKAKDPSCVPQFQQLRKVAMLPIGTFNDRPVYFVKDVEKSSPECYYSLKCWKSFATSMYSPLNEKNALKGLAGSPFIISFLGEYQCENYIYILTDVAHGGTLMRYMERKILSYDECVFFSANIVSVLSYVHGKGFVHRDIKPENLVIGSDGYLKLCDFGCSKRFPPKCSSLQVGLSPIGC